MTLLFPRLPLEDERLVLLAMHQTLVKLGLCLREQTDKGPWLVFPSYYRRERPELVNHPAALVSYLFNGYLDDIYATLVVRLHHTELFERHELWRYAADFKSATGKQLGFKLIHRGESAGELEVYFDTDIPVEEKIIFIRYIHEHLLRKAADVVRERHYACPSCSTPVANREVVMRRLAEGKQSIICVNCEKYVPLWDQLEQTASLDIQERVRQLEQQSATKLDVHSQERVLVGEVITTVAMAGQISRELSTSDFGIDMEVEFRDDAGQATGHRLYLQLKVGDSYLRTRRERRCRNFYAKKRAPRLLLDEIPVSRNARNTNIRW